MACAELNGILSSKRGFVMKKSHVQRYKNSFCFKLKLHVEPMELLGLWKQSCNKGF